MDLRRRVLHSVDPPGFYYVKKPKRFVILSSDKSSERNLPCFFGFSGGWSIYRVKNPSPQIRILVDHVFGTMVGVSSKPNLDQKPLLNTSHTMAYNSAHTVFQEVFIKNYILLYGYYSRVVSIRVKKLQKPKETQTESIVWTWFQLLLADNLDQEAP